METDNVLVIIQAWEQRNKLVAYKRYIPLLEAYRRTMYFAKGDATKCKILARPSELKKVRQYFKPTFGCEVSFTLNWYSLTPEGIEIVNDLIKSLEWDESLNTLLFNSNNF